MLAIAYLASAGLEIIGIAVVVVDVGADRKRARQYVDQPHHVRIPWANPTWTVQARIEEMEVERGGWYGRMLARTREEDAARSVQRVAAGAARAEMEARQAIADLLRGNLYRRLGGPALIVLGIVIGAVANIAAIN